MENQWCNIATIPGASRPFMRLVRYIADGELSLGVKSEDYVIGLSHKLSSKPESMVDLISEWDTLPVSYTHLTLPTIAEV